jgi:hypothetical protein
MATFEEHIVQANRNLLFLEKVNINIKDSIDWQVTACFYTALHLVNAHISFNNLQYRRHTEVKNVLNPFNTLSILKLPENEYVAYVSLQSLSRRARYLVNEKDNQLDNGNGFLTYDKHLAKSFKHLDLLMCFFSEKYNLDLNSIIVSCIQFKKDNNIKFIQKA